MSQLTPFSEFAEVFNGKTPSKSEKRDKGLPILKIKDVNANGLFKGKFESFVDNEFYKKHYKKKIIKGDTLILNAAHNADYVGSKQFRACSEVDGVIATGEWLIVRPQLDFSCSSYINHWLKSGEARFRLRNLVKGIHLYPKDVARLKIPLPPIKEQKRIAAILDKADAIRRKRQQAIDLTDQLLRSVFLDMFGDPVTNPKGWVVTSFGDLIDVLTDYHANGSYKILKKHVELKNTKDYALMVRTTDLESENFTDNVKWISESAYLFLKKTKVYGGEILVNKIGSAGAVYLMPHLQAPVSLAMNQFMIRCNEKCNNIFAYHYLKTEHAGRQIKERVQGAVTKTITKDAMRSIQFINPPIELQDKFIDIIKKIEKDLVTKLNSDKLDELISSLTQQAFNGQLSKPTQTS